MPLHTSSAYQRELTELTERLIAMGTRCERQIEAAASAIRDRNAELAARVQEEDRLVDADEMEIDELTVRILALRQPAARDLRFLVFALKVVTDLERIGDEAANVAERAAQLTTNGFEVPELEPRVLEMAEVAKGLVREALDAFVERDEALARGVRLRDDEVDALYGALRRSCLAYLRAHPERAAAAMCVASTAKYLERIADHATNIAEMVVFVTSGQDVRHPTKR